MPEEQAFCVLVKIMYEYGLRALYKNNFEDLHCKFYQLERLMQVGTVVFCCFFFINVKWNEMHYYPMRVTVQIRPSKLGGWPESRMPCSFEVRVIFISISHCLLSQRISLNHGTPCYCTSCFWEIMFGIGRRSTQSVAWIKVNSNPLFKPIIQKYSKINLEIKI